MKVVKSIIYILISIVSVIIIIGFSAAYFYGDKIQEIAIEELNKNLKAKVGVENVEVSFLQNLPYVSIILDNVYIKSVNGFNAKSFKNINTDTLLFARKLTLNFDIYKAVKNEFDLKKLTISDGKINLLCDEKGNDNYHFWDDTESDETSSLNINLNSVILENIKLAYLDKAGKIETFSQIKNAKLSGQIESNNIIAKSDIDAVITSFSNNHEEYISNLITDSKLDLTITNEKISIHSGNLNLDELKVNLSGDYIFSSSEFVNFEFSSKIISLDNLYKLIPNSLLSKDIKDNFSGLVSFSGTINGVKNPILKLNYAYDNGTIKYNNLDNTIKNISSFGEYSGDLRFSSDNSTLIINKLNLSLSNNKYINSKISLVNFNRARIKGELDINIDLEILSQLKALKENEAISGILNGNIIFEGLTTDFKTLNTNNLTCSGEVNAQGIEYGEINAPPDYKVISSKLSLKGEDLEFKDTEAIYNNNNYTLNGLLINPLQSFLKEKPYNISSTIFANKIVIPSDESSSDEDFDLTSIFNLEGKIIVNELVYDKIVATNISSEVIYSTNTIKLNNLDFKMVNGSIKSDLIISQSSNKIIRIYGSADLIEIDIHEFFFSFENFGQTFLQSKNITGDLSGKIGFDTKWTPQFDIIDNEILIESSVEVINGELYDFEPMMELSSYLRVPDLEHISFSNIRNDIVIQEQKVFIPLMEIKSTALNLDISGVHDFNQNISYDITLLLSDILSKRFKTDKPNDWEEYTDESLETKIYLTAIGNVDDFEIKYDFKKAKENRKENRAEEKKELKAVLHKELGLFKKDSTELKNVLDNKENKKKKKVKIIWDEDEE